MFWNAFSAPRQIDRVFLSDSESVALDDFVDGYLRSRNFSPTPANREMVLEKLSSFRRRAPVRSEDLVSFLDKGWLN
jgi:hypothetical protein